MVKVKITVEISSTVAKATGTRKEAQQLVEVVKETIKQIEELKNKTVNT